MVEEYSGIVRNVVNGSVNIPTSWYKRYGITTSVEITQTDKGILLTKPNNMCSFCGSSINLTDIYGKKVCRVCMLNIVHIYHKELGGNENGIR